jgi:hypothetical protein
LDSGLLSEKRWFHIPISFPIDARPFPSKALCYPSRYKYISVSPSPDEPATPSHERPPTRST